MNVLRLPALLLWASLLLIACASTPPSTTLPQARIAVKSAENSEIKNYAAEAVKAARDKLSQAESAAANKDNEQAEYFAQQAMVNIELAEVVAKSRKTSNQAQELENSIRNFKAEMEWRSPIDVTPLDQ